MVKVLVIAFIYFYEKSLKWEIRLWAHRMRQKYYDSVYRKGVSKNHILLYIDVQKYNCDNINNKIDIVNLNI